MKATAKSSGSPPSSSHSARGVTRHAPVTALTSRSISSRPNGPGSSPAKPWKMCSGCSLSRIPPCCERAVGVQQAGTDDADVGLGEEAEHHVEPVGLLDQHVVVEQHDVLATRRGDAGVASAAKLNAPPPGRRVTGMAGQRIDDAGGVVCGSVTTMHLEAIARRHRRGATDGLDDEHAVDAPHRADSSRPSATTTEPTGGPPEASRRTRK